MKYWDWYLKIAAGSALIGGSMEFFMIKTGFCSIKPVFIKLLLYLFVLSFPNLYTLLKCLMVGFTVVYSHYDKVTVLESEKRVWDNSPEAQALRDALNPWKNHDSKAENDS